MKTKRAKKPLQTHVMGVNPKDASRLLAAFKAVHGRHAKSYREAFAWSTELTEKERIKKHG